MGLPPAEFYKLDPAEFHYALESLFEYRRALAREMYEVARFNAVLVVNPTLKTKFQSPKDYVEFEWERLSVPKTGQTIEDHKRALLTLATHIRDKKTGELKRIRPMEKR